MPTIAQMQHDDHDDEVERLLGPAPAAQELDDGGATAHQVLLQAAKAASSLLPQLERQVEELRAQIEMLKPIAAYGMQHQLQSHLLRTPLDLKSFVTKRYRVHLNPEPIEAVSGTDASKIVEDIDLVLGLHAPMRVKELKDLIKEFCERSWGESTLYAYLSRGKKEGKYKNENGLWSLSTSTSDEGKLW